jgi:hypothetical protein
MHSKFKEMFVHYLLVENKCAWYEIHQLHCTFTHYYVYALALHSFSLHHMSNIRPQDNFKPDYLRFLNSDLTL